uniref:Uncharacterized protein n=1 Tax=Candidatus Kentrum sp. TUN TaxID=2126343 RepID=A0A451AJD1_9GAMM|nr:MAG: hypothetical protein BECKTUN1418D_GA0071000_14392 [Candidatus Kentron sp. TUN]
MFEPTANGFLGYPRAITAGNDIFRLGFLPYPRIEPFGSWRQVDKVRDQPITEQGDLMAAVIIIDFQALPGKAYFGAISR